MNVCTSTKFVLIAALLAAAPLGFAQSTAPASGEGSTAGSGAAAPAPLPSTIFTPALAQIRQALAIVRPEKWKAPGPVTQDTLANVASIQRDLDGTLPGLLATADSNPASVAEVLPAYRNVEALYDVLLRVTEMAKIVAPDPQSIALQQSLRSLDDSRRALGQQLQASAVSQTRAIVALQTQLRTTHAPAVATVAAPACPPAPAPKRRARTAKSSSTTAKSASTATTAGQGH
jgi:hypothetical protein